MATQWFMRRPDVRCGVQWTGDNLAELEAWATQYLSFILPLVENEDGTVRCAGIGWVLYPTDWATTFGYLTDGEVQAMQQVSGVPPFSWDVTGS